MNTREAFEVFVIGAGSTYSGRTVLGVYDTEAAAKRFASMHRARWGRIYLVRINGRWHRYFKTPIEVQTLVVDDAMPNTDDSGHHGPSDGDSRPAVPVRYV